MAAQTHSKLAGVVAVLPVREDYKAWIESLCNVTPGDLAFGKTPPQAGNVDDGAHAPRA